MVGAPNVGKSTLINALRLLGTGKAKVSQTGRHAGVTRTIQTRVKINEDPPIYLFDTPGIFNPVVSGAVEGLKIALTGGTNDKLTSMVNVADYLIFRMNNNKGMRDSWHIKVGLDSPTDDVNDVLLFIARRDGLRLNDRSRMIRVMGDQGEDQLWDFDKAAEIFVEMYRDGLFGRMTLDDLNKENLKMFFDGELGRETAKYSKNGYDIES